MSVFSVFLLLTLPWLNPFVFGPSPGVVSWLVSLACAGLVFGVRAYVGSSMSHQTWVRAIAAAWLVAALLSAIIGLAQYFGVSDIFAPWVNGTSVGEAFGNLRQRNQYATLMAIGFAALLFWVAQGTSWRLAAVAAVLLALGNAASSSRTGLAQWVLLIGLASQWEGVHRTSWRRVLLVAALAYAAATFALPWLVGLDPLNSSAWARLRVGDAACAGRIPLWSNVLHLIAQRPWFGWGWGELSYAHFTSLYPGARFCDILDNAHNLPLHFAVELGVPFSLGVCGAVLWWAVRANPLRETDPMRQMAWMVLAALGLHSLLEYPLWYGPFQIAAGLSAWILWRSPYASARAAKHFEPYVASTPKWVACVALVSLVSCAYAGWDYWRVSQLYLPSAERASVYRDNTMDKVRASWLFKNQVGFAELTTTPVVADNAAHLHALALQLLHFSPEPRVAEKLIESAQALGLEDEVIYYRTRYQAAFPEAYARWVAESTRDVTP